MVFVLFVLAVAVVAYRCTKPEERKKIARLVMARGREFQAATRRPEVDEFHASLRKRSAYAPATIVIAGLNVAVFVFMLLGPRSLDDPTTLLAWGASFGPRTTNQEWWRLATSMFVHGGLIHLFVELITLVQAGFIIERLAGSAVFATAYLGAGILAALVNLSLSPIVVADGSSGAVFGVYGLFAAWFVINRVQKSPLTIPARALQRLAPAALVFVLYSLAFGNLAAAANTAGLLVGCAYGFGIAIGAGDGLPVRRVAVAAFATLVIAVAGAVPLRGMADVRPEFARIVELEQRTAAEYQHIVDSARNHQIDTDKLIRLINTSIIPDLRSARARLKAIDRVPPEHQPLVTAADEYFRLRLESWRLRAEGLSKTNMLKLRQSERTERDSFEALEKIKPATVADAATPPPSGTPASDR